MEITCPECRQQIKIKQPHAYHARLSNQGFLYCDRDPTILVFSVYDPKYVDLVGEVHPWMLDRDQEERVETQLVQCPCGGRFLFSNAPRCPSCGASLASCLPSSLHYLILGRLIDGDRERIWKD